jgi:hypothetical protein
MHVFYSGPDFHIGLYQGHGPQIQTTDTRNGETMPEQTLNDTQVTEFKRQGCLVLPGFVEESLLEEWRQSFWQHLGGSFEDQKSWPDDPAASRGFVTDPVFGELPRLQAIVHQLGGGHFSGGGCGVNVRWPQTETEWSMPESGHLDGYPGEGCQAVLMLAATTALYDVEPGGGAFVYWPSSHGQAHRYFRQYPDRIEGTFRDTPEWDKRGWGIFSDEAPQGPVEFSAKAGDLILWHGWLCHTGSTNIRKSPRIGLFARWLHEDDAAMRREIPEDIWQHWAV